ncbi:MAG: DUF4177 domain-containing protein [Brevefilum sp.]|nr:DUF4177 domain-containing protein [Brevefilum sp.]
MEWEYKVITMRTEGFMGGKVDISELETALNNLGKEGWELTAAFDTNEGYGRTRDVVVLFKRPMS